MLIRLGLELAFSFVGRSVRCWWGGRAVVFCVLIMRDVPGAKVRGIYKPNPNTLAATANQAIDSLKDGWTGLECCRALTSTTRIRRSGFP